jgi:hypothetical protein
MRRSAEEYRRKAAECARKALASTEAVVRGGYAEAARRWRALADKSEGRALCERKRAPAQLIILPRRGAS